MATSSRYNIMHNLNININESHIHYMLYIILVNSKFSLCGCFFVPHQKCSCHEIVIIVHLTKYLKKKKIKKNIN
jgi:hypothetical protein